jgi:alkylation response protein AidB-like acyl-CoA dehydrogenase
MGWASSDFAIALGVAPFPFNMAAMSGNPDIIENIIKPFAEDRRPATSAASTYRAPARLRHSSSGRTPSDAGDGVRGAGDADGDEWVISGQKSAWVSNGTIATHALAFLGVDRARGASGGAVAIIPLDRPGVTKGKPLDKLGQRALNQGEIFFDSVRIPKHYMLVPTEAYPFIIESVLAGANAGMGAIFTGTARAAFEEGLNYARQRVQGGKAITEHQAVQLKIMDMFIKVEAARQLRGPRWPTTRRQCLRQSSTRSPRRCSVHAPPSKCRVTRSSFTAGSAWRRRCWSRSSSATPVPP